MLNKSAGNQQRLLLQLVIGLAVACCGGIVFCFSLVVPALKAPPFRYDESEISTIAGISSIASFFSLPAGLMYDHGGGPRPTLFTGLCIMCTAWFLLAYVVFTKTEDDFGADERGRAKLSIQPLITALFSLVMMANTFCEMSVMMSAFDAIRLHPGFVIVTYKSFIGIGSSVISLIFAGFFATDDEQRKAPLAGAFCEFVGIYVLVILSAGVIFTSVPPVSGAGKKQPPGTDWSFLARWWDVRVLGANTLPDVELSQSSSASSSASDNDHVENKKARKPTSAKGKNEPERAALLPAGGAAATAPTAAAATTTTSAVPAEQRRLRRERRQKRQTKQFAALIQRRLDAQSRFRPVLSAGYKLLFFSLFCVTASSLLELAVGESMPRSGHAALACICAALPLLFLYLLRVAPGQDSSSSSSSSDSVVVVSGRRGYGSSGGGSDVDENNENDSEHAALTRGLLRNADDGASRSSKKRDRRRGDDGDDGGSVYDDGGASTAAATVVTAKASAPGVARRSVASSSRSSVLGADDEIEIEEMSRAARQCADPDEGAAAVGASFSPTAGAADSQTPPPPSSAASAPQPRVATSAAPRVYRRVEKHATTSLRALSAASTARKPTWQEQIVSRVESAFGEGGAGAGRAPLPLYDLDAEFEEPIPLCDETVLQNLFCRRPLDMLVLWTMCACLWGSMTMIYSNVTPLFYALQTDDYVFTTGRNAVMVSIVGIGNAIGRAAGGLMLPALQSRAKPIYFLLRLPPLVVALGSLLFVVARGAAIVLPCFFCGLATGLSWAITILCAKRLFSWAGQTYAFLYTAAIAGVCFFVLFLFPHDYETHAEAQEAARTRAANATATTTTAAIFATSTAAAAAASTEASSIASTTTTTTGAPSSLERHCHGFVCVELSIYVVILSNVLAFLCAEVFIRRVDSGHLDSQLAPLPGRDEHADAAVVDEFLVKRTPGEHAGASDDDEDHDATVAAAAAAEKDVGFGGGGGGGSAVRQRHGEAQ